MNHYAWLQTINIKILKVIFRQQKGGQYEAI